MIDSPTIRPIIRWRNQRRRKRVIVPSLIEALALLLLLLPLVCFIVIWRSYITITAKAVTSTGRSSKQGNGRDQGTPFHLDTFVPLNNASVTFTLEDFTFVLLHEAQKDDNAWMVPDYRHDVTTHLSASSVHPLLSTSSTTEKTVKNTIINNMNVCQIFCRFEDESFLYWHFPHFQQQVLPCWNILHHFATSIGSGNHSNRIKYYMILPDQAELTSSSKYIRALIQVMESHPYNIEFIYGFEQKLPIHSNCYPAFHDHLLSSTTNPLVSILAIKSFKDTGWDRPVKYFLSTNSTPGTGTAVATTNASNRTLSLSSLLSLSNFDAVQQLQRAVLQNEYIEPSTTCSTFKNNMDHTVIVQVLVLDRQLSFRHLIFARDIILALKDFEYTTTNYNNDTLKYQVNLTYIHSFNEYSFLEQARAVHLADVIYSPHGAQLANLVYIRPCTAVVEFFPRHYYVQFFTPLVLNAYGISLEAYPSAGNKIVETLHMLQAIPDRTAEVRSVSIDVGPQFFLKTISRLIDATAHCRSNIII